MPQDVSLETQGLTTDSEEPTGSLSLVPFNPWQLLKATAWQWMYGI